MRLTLFQHSDKSGDKVTWTEDASKQLVSHLSDHDFNDRASSFRTRYKGP